MLYSCKRKKKTENKNTLFVKRGCSSLELRVVSVAQSCLILCDPMDCSVPGSSVHGILQARILKQVFTLSFRGIFLTQGLNLGLLRCRQILHHLSHLC